MFELATCIHCFPGFLFSLVPFSMLSNFGQLSWHKNGNFWLWSKYQKLCECYFLVSSPIMIISNKIAPLRMKMQSLDEFRRKLLCLKDLLVFQMGRRRLERGRQGESHGDSSCEDQPQILPSCWSCKFHFQFSFAECNDSVLHAMLAQKKQSNFLRNVALTIFNCSKGTAERFLPSKVEVQTLEVFYSKIQNPRGLLQRKTHRRHP